MKTQKSWVTACALSALVSSGGCSHALATSPSQAAGAGLAAAVAPDAAAPSRAVHSVTGSGEVTYFGVSFRNSVAAHADASGNAWGEVSVPLNLSSEGLGRIEFSGKVTCLAVDGATAWIGFDVAHSNNGDVVPAGASAIALVRDLGGPGQDITDGEFFPSNVRCTDRPTEFLETVVLNGNYTVR